MRNIHKNRLFNMNDISIKKDAQVEYAPLNRIIKKEPVVPFVCLVNIKY